MTALETATVQVAGRKHQLRYRHGTSDEHVIRQIFGQAQYSYAHLRRAAELDRIAREAEYPLIIDAGANIGASAVYFALCFPNAQIIAIEPDADNFALLAHNTKGLHVLCNQCALSSSRGEFSVYDPGEGAWGYRTHPTNGGPTVSGLTVNDLYEGAKNPIAKTPFIVKIDVEGAEGEIFSRNTEWVAETPVIMIEPHDWLLPKQSTFSSFLQCIAGQQRDFVIVGENIFSIRHDL